MKDNELNIEMIFLIIISVLIWVVFVFWYISTCDATIIEERVLTPVSDQPSVTQVDVIWNSSNPSINASF
jgi:hypothetical protein